MMIKSTIRATLLATFGLSVYGHGATRVDSVTVVGSSEFTDATRGIAKLIDGVDLGQIFVAVGGSPSNPADWRQNTTVANNQFGQGSTWHDDRDLDPIGDFGEGEWLLFDLGQDRNLETMNIFAAAYSLPNSAFGTGRSLRDCRIYYSTEAAGEGGNTANALTDTALITTPFTLLTTLQEVDGTELTRPVGGETAMVPDAVDFTGVTARYVVIEVISNYGSDFTTLSEVQFFEVSAVVDDPVLSLDGGSPDTDFDFGNVFEGGPAPSKTLTFLASSSGGNTLTVDSVTLTNDGGGAFSLTPVATPLALNDGDTFDVVITANSPSSGDFTGEVVVDTLASGTVSGTFNDQTIPISSSVFASGSKLNPNPTLEAGLTDWDTIGPGGANFSVIVSPGIAAGSSNMARVVGSGDPSGFTTGSNLGQSTQIPNGAPNWQFSAFFTPIDSTNFASYVDADGALGITGPDAGFTDRTFQLIFLSADTGRPFPIITDGVAGGTLINIAYMPAGVQGNTTPDFYVFNGSTGLWEATGIGAIVGSVDGDADSDPLNGFGDGILDPNDVDDIINSYRIVVTGSGFGSPGASYDITVSKFSGTDTFVSGSAAGLTAFQGVSGDTVGPAGYYFVGGDESSDLLLGSNQGDGVDPGFTTPFWVDDVCYFNGTAPDPALAVISKPSIITFENPTTSGTSTFTVRNDGLLTTINLDASFANGGNGFSITSPSMPVAILPGAIQDIEVTWDSALASANYEFDTLTLSDAGNEITTDCTVAGGLIIATYGKSNLPNYDFETLGSDPVTDSDTFANWDEFPYSGSFGGAAEGIIDVPGLIAGTGTTAAFVVGNPTPTGEMNNPLTDPLSNFVVEADFAINNTGGTRRFNMWFQHTASIAAEGGGGNNINVRYQSDTSTWEVFADLNGLSGWQQVIDMSGSPLAFSEDNDSNFSLEDPGDVKNTYKIRFTGEGWGTILPSYTIDILDSTGSTVLASSGSIDNIWRGAIPVASNAEFVEVIFSQQFQGAGFWVDNVCVTGSLLDTPDPNPATGISLLNAVFISGAPNTVTADIISGGNVDIYRSTTLQPGSWGVAITTDLAPGNAVVIDSNASLTDAYYIAVPTGEAAP